MALYIGPAWRIGALFLDPIIAEKRVLRGAIRWNLGFGEEQMSLCGGGSLYRVLGFRFHRPYMQNPVSMRHDPAFAGFFVDFLN